MAHWYRSLRAAAPALLVLLAALPAQGYTPTNTFGPSPTPTRTGTPGPGIAVITAVPNPARPQQRVVLDGTASIRDFRGRHWMQVGGDVAIEIENADETIASFVIPSLSGAAEVTVELSLGPGSIPAQQTIQLLPPETIRLDIDRVVGAPDNLVDVNVVMRPLGYAVTRLDHELHFDGFAAVASLGPGGRPDCTPGSFLAVDSHDFTFLPVDCTPGVDCDAVRALITTREPIADGAVVYRCNVLSRAQVSSTADCFHALTCGAGAARRADGSDLAVACVEGGVTVDYSVTPVTFSLTAEPANPMVGDTVQVTVSAFGQGGLPAFSLQGAAPYLRIVSSPPPMGGPLGGNPVVFETIADCPGVANLSVFLSYEARCGCSTSPFFCFAGASSQSYEVRLREPGGFIVSGRVAEFPLGCSGAMRGVTVQLDPLGWTTQTDLAAGRFSFGGVPPGDYTLAVFPSCNPFGCWPAQSIHVEDTDVGLDVCPQRNGPGGCAGDCNDDGRVMVHELVISVAIALGVDDVGTCRAADTDASGTVAIDDLTRAIVSALEGCPGV
jgi:hypothetical protein